MVTQTKAKESKSDKQQAIDWAKSVVQRPDLRFLDTETTGLGNAFIVEIAVLSRYGSVMLNTLVKPPKPIPEEAQRIHGISNEMVADAPEFPAIYPRLKEVIERQHVCIYNAGFDTAIINNCVKYYGLEPIEYGSTCAMEWYAQFYGDWSSYWGNYKWQKLPNGGHRAKEDAFACYELVKYMANSTDEIELQIKKEQKLFPPIQLACKWNSFIQFAYRLKEKEHYYDEFGRFKKLFSLSYPKFYWMGNFSNKLDKKNDPDDIPF